MSTPSEASTPHARPASEQWESPGAPGSHEAQLNWSSPGADRGPGAMKPVVHRRPFPVSILDRYVLREIMAPFGFAVAAFTLFLLINTFFLAAEYVINKAVPFVYVMRYIVLQIPSFVYLILPFSTLFGVLQGFGRLAGDNELTAMRTSGVPLLRIARPALALGVLLTIVAFLTNEYVAPESQHKSQAVFRQIAYHSSQPIIAPDQFIRTEDGRHSIYVSSVDPQSGIMHNVQIYSLGNGYFPETLTALSAQQQSGKLVLYNGVQTFYNSAGLVTKQQHFATLEFPLADAGVLFEGPRGPFEMNSRDLSKEIKARRATGDDIKQLQITLQQKYAMPMACLISILIALPLGARFGKQGRGVGAMLAIVVLFVYYLIMSATYALGKNGAIPANLAPWIPNVVLAAAGIAMLWKEER